MYKASLNLNLSNNFAAFYLPIIISQTARRRLMKTVVAVCFNFIGELL